MGFEDYNNGWWSPNQPPDLRDPNWQEYQQGQNDRKKMLGMQPYSGPGSAAAGAPASGPQLPPRPSPMPRKHLFLGLVATLFGGPLGLFYVSKKGAVAMLALVAVAYFETAHSALPPAEAAATFGGPGLIVGGIIIQPMDVWVLAGFVLVAWSVMAILLHNRRAAARDAANLVTWQAAAGRIQAEYLAHQHTAK